MLEFHPDAIEEAREARHWYEERSAVVADAFMAELDYAILQISESPNRWPAYSNETRRYLLHRFPFMVVFREKESVIQVIAIAHARRRPDYWKDRTR